jgi:hypothetical protein
MQKTPHSSQFLSLRETRPRVNAPRVGPLMRTCIRREANALDGNVPPQVSAKAQGLPKFIVRWIDAVSGWRYSQAQIPDLVAYAIPRFSKAAQSIGSALPSACRFPAKSCAVPQCNPSGAKAHAFSVGIMRGLKPPSPSGMSLFAASEAYAAALDPIRRQFTSTSQSPTGGY